MLAVFDVGRRHNMASGQGGHVASANFHGDITYSSQMSAQPAQMSADIRHVFFVDHGSGGILRVVHRA